MWLCSSSMSIIKNRGPSVHSSILPFGCDSNLNIENRFQWSDNVSWTHGAHAVKWGVDIRRQRFDTLKGTPFFGQEIFGATFTSSSNAAGSGLPLADFLLGYPSFIQGTPMIDWGRQRSIYAGGF